MKYEKPGITPFANDGLGLPFPRPHQMRWAGRDSNGRLRPSEAQRNLLKAQAHFFSSRRLHNRIATAGYAAANRLAAAAIGHKQITGSVRGRLLWFLAVICRQPYKLQMARYVRQAMIGKCPNR